jgi:hypothetical protein
MMVIPSNVNCSIHEKHQKQHMAHYCTSHMARMRAYIYGPNSGIYIIYIYIHISNARKLKCPNESIKPHLSIVSMDIHGYPESFSSPNGTPLELRGFQPDQSRRIFRARHVFAKIEVSRCWAPVSEPGFGDFTISRLSINMIFSFSRLSINIVIYIIAEQQ